MRLHLSIAAAVMGLCLSLLATGEARAATFTIEDPEVDFDVLDINFDGLGDEVFDTFNIVLLGTTGEAREIAEFGISGFSIPPSEVISGATFQVRISSTIVCGLGLSCTGDTPDSLGVYGYVGNGIAEASDFQAGTLLDTIAPPSYSAGQLLTFDVTAFVQSLVSNGDSFVGLGVRAQEFGGIAIEELSTLGFPRLTITTAAVPATIPEPTSALGLLAFGAFGAGSMLKRKQKKQLNSASWTVQPPIEGTDSLRLARPDRAFFAASCPTSDH